MREVQRPMKGELDVTTNAQVSLAPPFTRETAILKVRKAEDNWPS